MPTTGMPSRAEIDLLVEDPGWTEIDLETLATRAAEATLAHLGIDGPARVVVLATSDGEVARLNAEFRGKPGPTNVLSWPAAPLAPPAPGQPPPPPRPDITGEIELGDIALAHGTCAREAQNGGIPLTQHATHLVVHGLLHLLGYDHICDEDAGLMERTEIAILHGLGAPDPYCR